MEVIRQPLGGNGNGEVDPKDFRVRQLRARQMLKGELTGEDPGCR
jgi:hypothetical protein